MSESALTLRPARATDMAAIGEITARSWRHVYAGLLPDDFLSSLTPVAQQERHERRFARGDVRYCVAEEGGQVIGFASWGPCRASGLSAGTELYALYLRPGYERRGIGSRIFDRARAEIPANQPGLYLTALAMNPNRAFYRRHGGTEVAAPDIQLGGTSYPQIGFIWP